MISAPWFCSTEVNIQGSLSWRSFPELLPGQAAGKQHWVCFGWKQVAIWPSKKWSLGRGRQSFTFPRTCKTPSWGAFHVSSSGNLDQLHTPASPISFFAIFCLGQKICRDGPFLGIVPQFCKWAPDPCGCCNAAKWSPPWVVLEWSLLAPLQAAGQGWCSSPSVPWVGGKCPLLPRTHPEWHRERHKKKFPIFAPAKLRVKLEICACFLFFSNAWLWPRISYRHSNLVRLMALVSLVTNATPARHLALNSLDNHYAFFKV